MINKFKYFSTLMAIGFFANMSVFADNFQVNGINNNLMQTVTIDYNSTQESVYTGALQGTLNGVSTYFFCYDLNHTISVPGTYTATVLSPVSSSFPSNLLLPSSFNIQVATSMVNAEFASLSTLNQYTALQLAIWNVLYDWSPGVTPNLSTSCTTGFCAPGASSSVIADANQYLAAAQQFASAFPNSQSLGTSGLVTSMSGNNVNQVLLGVGLPEPGTYLIMGSLLAITLGATRCRKASKLE